MQVGVAEVARQVCVLALENVVITGGEPLLQQRQLVELATVLKRAGKRIEVETSGTVQPGDVLSTNIDQWNVSPKLANSRNHDDKRKVPEVLNHFASQPNAFFKFVVVAPDDLLEVEELVAQYSLNPAHVLLMPEGRTPKDVMERSSWLAAACQTHGYRFTTRLHVILWGDKRGR
jgi:organic radical activating enzyme